MLRKLAYSLALLPAFWLASAQALGLGEIDVRSKLNQRFTATIPVISASPEELSSLTLRLAKPEEFARAGIERSDYLSTIDFSLAPGAGSNQVRVSSSQIARDPFLTFIIEATWNGGKLLREYTVLLDPPPSASEAPAAAPAPAPAKPVVAAPSPAPAASPAPVIKAPASVEKPAPAPKPVPVVKAPEKTPEKTAEKAPEAAVTPAGNEVGSYGPVKGTDTLWSIANKLRPGTEVSIDQMLLSIYEANPKSFEGGINGLLKGGRLTVPTLAQIKEVDAATAKARVLELRGLKAPAAEPKAEPKIEAKVEPAAPAPVVAKAPPVAAAPPPAAPAAPAVVEAPAPAAPPAAETKPEEAAAPAAAPEGAPTAEAVNPETAAAQPTTETPAPAIETPAAAPAPAASSGLLEDYQLQLIGLIGVLLIGLIALAVIRSRRNSNMKPTRSTLASPMEPTLPPMPDFTMGHVDDKYGEDTAPADTMADEMPAEEEPPMLAESVAPPMMSPAATEMPFDAGINESGTTDFNLDANDPLTEADFHIAYGLYDEAIQLLKQAAAQDPERTELRTKLAETYFASSKAMEFQDLAETLHGQLSASEWQKIATMGRQLCPDANLFKNESEQSLSFAGFDSPISAPSVPETEALNIIDFDLDKALGEPMRLQPETPAPAATNMVDLDLSSFDLGGDSPVQASDLQDGKVDFDLEELDLGHSEESDAALTLGDEIDTKLDLARAYADMGDNDAARSLLAEVIEGGNEMQKKEAEGLNQRLTSA